MGKRQRWLAQVQLACAAVFVLVPLLWMVRLAFDGTIDSRPTDFALWPREWTSANLRRAWAQPRMDVTFATLLGNSLVVATIPTTLATLAGTAAGYAFARRRRDAPQWLLVASLTLLALPPAALLVPYFLILNDLGMRDSLWGLVGVYSAVGVPLAIWISRAATLAVPRTLDEAAMLDGAGQGQIFWAVILPQIAPSVAVAALMVWSLAWSEFALGWVLISKPQDVTLAMALHGMVGQSSVSWGLLSAMALLTIGPLLIVFYALGRWARSGFALGAVSAEDA